MSLRKVVPLNKIFPTLFSYLLHRRSKLKIVPSNAMKTYGWSRGTTPLVNLSTKHRWAISLTLLLLYPIYPPNSRFGRQQSQFGCLQEGKMFWIFRDSNAGSSSLSPVATLTVLCRLQDKKYVFWKEEIYSCELYWYIKRSSKGNITRKVYCVWKLN